MAWWDIINSETTYGWNPTPGPGQRNDYSVPLPVGTPIVSPVTGIVLPMHTTGGGYYSYYGRMPWGGEADILTALGDYPGTLQDVNILHFDTLAVQPGDFVIKGQTVLGTSGGQQTGGNWPSDPRYSKGPHIGVGVHSVPSWDQMYDPQQLITDLLAGVDHSSMPSAAQLQAAGLGGIPQNGTPGGVPQAYSSSSAPGDLCSQYGVFDPRGIFCLFSARFGTLTRWLDEPVRFLKLAAGVGLIVFGFLLFLVSTFGPDVAAAGVAAAGVPEAAPAVKMALQRNKGPEGVAKGAITTVGNVQAQKVAAKRVAAGRQQESLFQRAIRSRNARKGPAAVKARRAAGVPTKAEEQVERNRKRGEAMAARSRKAQGGSGGGGDSGLSARQATGELLPGDPGYEAEQQRRTAAREAARKRREAQGGFKNPLNEP